MLYTIKLLERAENELNEGCVWYEERKKGLGRRFLKEVNSQLLTIRREPKLFQVQGKYNHRFVGLKKFPFVVVYWCDDKNRTIYVISIFHTSRSPII